MEESNDEAVVIAPEVLQQPTPPPSDLHTGQSTDTHIANQRDKRMDIDEETSAPDMLSPISAEGDKQEEAELPALANTDLGSPSMGYDFSNIRVGPHCISSDNRTN